MSSFPHIVTVLNKVSTGDEVIYLPTILDGVLYVTSRSSSKSSTGSENKDDIKCTIPFRVNVVESKTFTDRKTFDDLPEEEKPKYWTLTKDDIIVKDIIVDPQISLRDVNRMYPERMVVSYVNTYDFGALRHWMVGGA